MHKGTCSKENKNLQLERLSFPKSAIFVVLITGIKFKAQVIWDTLPKWPLNVRAP